MPLDGVLQNISLTPPHLDKNAVWVHNCNKPNKPFVPEKHWNKNAPHFVPPGTKNLRHNKINKRSGKLEKSDVEYDEYGRQSKRRDYTDHGHPESHSNPHDHKYEYGPGKDPTYGQGSTINYYD